MSDIVLRRNREFDKSNRSGIWTTIIPEATLSKPTTDEWKAQRQIWQDVMHPDFLRRVVAQELYDTAANLARLWTTRCALAGAGRPVDVGEDFSFAALDAIWRAAFGDRLELVDAQIERLETGRKIESRGLDMHSTTQYIKHLANTW